MLKHSVPTLIEDGLILSGYLKKLKTMKKKYFVLFKETLCNAARLEYYDNEKKFKVGLPPKRVIKIKYCFNINRRLDTKYDYVIALSTKDGGFGIVLETKEDMLKWLEVLISLQRCEANISDSVRPNFEHCWQVAIQKKGLADEKGIVGKYYVGLTVKSVIFIRIGEEKTTAEDTRISNIEFLLTTIRRCGDSHCVFYMEVGRQSIIGPGELWMETEDSLIAQNMHNMILSAMSAKADSYMEPMRKRSSSANEASKPINVVQRRQPQPENKPNNSPQTVLYFGRERCDSLPSRNRTTSECSNQSFTTSSVLTTRNSTISGLHPHSYQRHSNSPPTCSVIGCSESEESSISVDESDDNGILQSYRFNSRSTEGVILEENTDELISSENKMNQLDNTLNDHKEENYISMAPAKAHKDMGEPNKFILFKHINDTKYMPSVCLLNRGSPKSDIEFSEYSSDDPSTFIHHDMDSQSERPTRAYSIGSKAEHSKISKRMANASELDQCTVRVRAFSVGSRAKIPRCDLQRGVLFPKSQAEQNFNSNNNICSVAEVTPFNQLLNMNVCREKKSNSAPLLIHKSHNSVDRMSDLMEIDFSKSSNLKNNRIIPPVKTHFSKSVPSTARDQIKKYDLTLTAINRQEDSIQNNFSALAKTDNGYLEMRPIGNSVSKNAPTNLLEKDYLTNKPKMSDSADVSENKNQTISVLVNTNDTPGTSNYNMSPEYATEPISIPQRKIEQEIDRYRNDLPSKYALLSLSSAPKHECQNIKSDTYVNIKDKQDTMTKTKNQKQKYHNNVKLPHSISDEDYKYDSKSAAKISMQCKESSYKILKIKSDSSLQSQKPPNCPHKLQREVGPETQLTQSRPRSTNSPPLITSYSSFSTCASTSSSTSCLNNVAVSNTPITTKKSDYFFNSTLSNTPNISKHINSASRPPSDSSEHELCYASLDLPQCSTDVSSKIIKTTLNDSSSIEVSTINNSYAKIDFDHSDSSSSSSKNFNI